MEYVWIALAVLAGLLLITLVGIAWILSGIVVHPKNHTRAECLAYDQEHGVDLSAYGKAFPKEVLKERTEAARSLPGYTPFGTIVNNALLRRATKVEFEYNGETSVLKYFIDGLWHPVTDLFKRPLTPQASRALCMSMRAILGDNSPLEAELQKEKNQENAPKIQIPPKVAGQFFIEYDKRGGKKKKMAA